MPPHYGNGKICYLEIPASNVPASSSFYADVFGWSLREHSDGTLAFDDGVGEVSGMWVTDRPPMREPGIIISIMVDDAAASVDKLTASGAEIVRPLDPNGQEIIAWFRDPGGNVLGIYQEPSMTASG